VDFALTDDQVDLQRGMRAFIEGRFPMDVVRAGEELPRVVDRELWRELGGMGVFSLRSDGFGVREAVVVFEELGRALVPGPLVGSHLAAGLVDGAAAGSVVVGILDLGGPATVIEHLADCDRLVSFTPAGLVEIDPAALTTTPVERPLDSLTPLWTVSAPAPGELDGTPVATRAEAEQLHRVGVALTAALMVGVASAATELATAYAKQREQFGRTIGSFQAIKHLLADMFSRAEVARAGVHAAACALDGMSADDPDRAVSGAKLLAGEAAVFCGRNGVQVHGGMGFTWEVDAQRYWKRAAALSTQFGSGDAHAQRISEFL
jgi:alkylation response protein AidB-like acyl-CoA dehydrogenase